MATELIATPKAAVTLYELEDNLAALADTFEMVDYGEDRQMILDQIGTAMRLVKEKRDAVVAFLRHCEVQQKFADQEIERIKNRRDRIAKFQEELEQSVIRVIDQFVIPDRRGVKRMEGNVSSLRIQKNPDSVVITDDKALPVAWKDVVLTMPAHAWEALLERLAKDERAVFEAQVKRCEFRPDKRALANELKNGEEIPGADLKFGELRLVIG
jgi:hypothetical protein